MQHYKTCYGTTVSVDERLNSHQAGILYHDNDNISLISYTTEVLHYDFANDWLTCFGLYSPTTRRHISVAVQKIFRNSVLDYYDIKYLVTLGKDWVIANPFGAWYYLNKKTAQKIHGTY